MLETGVGGNVWQIFREYTLEKGCLPEVEKIHNTQFRLPPSECHSRCSDTEVQSFWCFLLADLSVEVQTAATAPFCPSLQVSTGSQREGVPS